MNISNNTAKVFSEFGIDKGVELLKKSGFDNIDVSISQFAREIREGTWMPIAKELLAAKEKYGVRYNQSHAPFGGGRGEPETRGYYYAHHVPHIPDALRMAEAAGIESVVVHPIAFLDTGYLGHEDEHFEANLKFFSSLIPVARELGIKVAIENLWITSPITGNIVNGPCADPREHIALFDELNAPDVITLCLDVGHSALVGREPEDVIRTLGHDRLGALHVHDVDYKNDLHTLPWQSKLHWEEIARALGEIDYTGDITLEADYFIAKLDKSILPAALPMMAATASHLGDLVDSYRPSK